MKKISVLLGLLLVFTLSGCGNPTTEDLHDAIANMENINNYKMEIVTSMSGLTIVTMEQYVTEEMILVHMDETIVSGELNEYYVIDGTTIYQLTPVFWGENTDTTPYLLTEITQDIDEMTNAFDDYDIFKENDFEYEDDYFIAKDIQLNLPGYEEIDSFSEVKIKIEDGYVTEMVFTMNVNTYGIDMEMTVSMFISEFNEVEIDAPTYYTYDELFQEINYFYTNGFDADMAEYGFHIAREYLFVEYRFDEFLISVTEEHHTMSYNPTLDIVYINQDTMTLHEYLTNYTSSLTWEEYQLIISMYDKYN